MQIEKEEGEDLEDTILKNIYSQKELEEQTGINIYKNLDYLFYKNLYIEKFNRSINKELSFHKKKITSMDWLENYNGMYFISSSIDNSIKLWDLHNVLSFQSKNNNSNSSGPLFTINCPHNEPVTLLVSTNSDNNFISNSSDKYIKLWDTKSKPKSPIKYEKMKDEVKILKFNKNGNLFAFINKEGNILYIYDYKMFKEIKQLSFKIPITDFIFDEDKLLITNDDGQILILNKPKYNIENIDNINRDNFPFYSIDINKDSTNFITAGIDGLIIEYDLREMMSSYVYKKSDQSIKHIQYSFDDNYISCVYDEKNLDIFSTEIKDHIYTKYTENPIYLAKWNKKKNILGYIYDDNNNSKKNTSEGNIHFLVIPSN